MIILVSIWILWAILVRSPSTNCGSKQIVKSARWEYFLIWLMLLSFPFAIHFISISAIRSIHSSIFNLQCRRRPNRRFHHSIFSIHSTRGDPAIIRHTPFASPSKFNRRNFFSPFVFAAFYSLFDYKWKSSRKIYLLFVLRPVARQWAPSNVCNQVTENTFNAAEEERGRGMALMAIYDAYEIHRNKS